MLADHAAGVFPRRARLRAETGRERGEPHRQGVFVEHGFAREIRQRNFRCGDEPEIVRGFDFPDLTALLQEVDDLSGRPGGGRKLIFGKLRQLRRTEHRVVAHQQRRIDLGIPVLACMQIEHELSERTLEPRQTFLQDHEARAGKLRGRLEVHLAERLTEIEMLLGRKAVAVLGPEMMVLHIVVGVLAVRHVGRRKRQVRNLRERVVEFLRELLLLRFQRRNRGLQLRDLGEKLLRRRFLVAFLRCADLLGRRVAPRQGRLRLLDGGAAALVEHDQLLGLRRQPAPRQRLVEGVGIVANPLDVVHGTILSGESPR